MAAQHRPETFDRWRRASGLRRTTASRDCAEQPLDRAQLHRARGTRAVPERKRDTVRAPAAQTPSTPVRQRTKTPLWVQQFLGFRGEPQLANIARLGELLAQLACSLEHGPAGDTSLPCT